METLQQVLAVAPRPGSQRVSSADVTSFLSSFSGNTSEIASIEDGFVIVGIRPDMVEGVKQRIGGNEATVFSVPVQVMPAAGGKASWKKISVGSLMRTHQDWNPTTDSRLADSLIHTKEFASNKAFLDAMHAHVGDGADGMAAVPAKHIVVAVNKIARTFDEGTANERKTTVRYYGLSPRG